MSSGAGLSSVRSSQGTEDNRQLATVFVPDGKLEIFLNKIRAYRDEQTTPRSERGISRPKNQDLVESIFGHSTGRIGGFSWTEHNIPFPSPRRGPGHGKCGYENLMVGINWNVSVRTHLGLNCSLVIGKHFICWTARRYIFSASERSEAALRIQVHILRLIAELREPQTDYRCVFFLE